MKWTPKTEKEKALLDILTNVWDDDDFIVGVMNDLESESERERVIRFIEESPDISTEEIVMLSLEIDQARTLKI